MKIHPVGTELSHADGRTNMTMLTAAFRNFTSTTKKKNQRILMDMAIPADRNVKQKEVERS
jgi:hypothetical protein